MYGDNSMKLFNQFILLVFISFQIPVYSDSLENVTDPLDNDWLIRADDMLILTTSYNLNSDAKSVKNTTPKWWGHTTDNEQFDTLEDVQSLLTVMDTDAITCSASQPWTQPYPQQTRIGRFYESDRDQVVTLTPNGNANGDGCPGTNNLSLIVQDAQDPSNPTTLSSTNITISPADWIQVGIEDINVDGYDDFVILSPNEIIIATATDPSDNTSSFTFYSTSLDSTIYPLTEPAFGDLDSDGNLEIIWTASDKANVSLLSSKSYPVSVYFATICSGAESGTYCSTNNLTTFDVSLSPQQAAPIALTNIEVSKAAENCDSKDALIYEEIPVPPTAVIAGSFIDDDFGDRVIIVAREASSSSCDVNAWFYEFSSDDLTPTLLDQQTIWDKQSQGKILGVERLFMISGKLDWNTTTESAYILLESEGTDSTYQQLSQITTSDGTLTSTDFSLDLNSDTVNNDYTIIAGKIKGLVLGRFDSIDTDALETDGNEAFDLYLALYRSEAYNDLKDQKSFDGYRVIIYDISLNSDSIEYELTKEDEFVTGRGNYITDISIRGGSLLRAGDLRGRGYRLGTPTVIELADNYQTDIVIAAPPMHAAWLRLSDLDTDLFGGDTLNDISLCNQQSRAITDDVYCLFNFSMIPDTFNTTYDVQTSNSNQSSSNDQTSYGTGYKADSTTKFSYGTADVSTVSASITAALEITYNSSFEQQYQNTTTSSFDMSAVTGTSDSIAYTQRQYNFYYYPLIGQTVCPDDSDDSDDSDDVVVCDKSLQISLSGPISRDYDLSEGSSTEFYQPVHQVGNIFTYPLNCEALENRYNISLCSTSDNPDLLTSTENFFLTTQTKSYSANWTSDSSAQTTTGTTNNYSYNIGSSLTGTVGSLKGTGASESLSFDYSNSTALSTAITNITTVGASTGISINIDAKFLTPNDFQYPIQGYAFGTSLPDNTLDSTLDSTSTTNDINTTGTLQFVYTADLTNSLVGTFWQDGVYSSNIDLGFAYSSRFTVNQEFVGSDPEITQCRSQDSGSILDCLIPTELNSDVLWNSDFYQMRGFFITDGEEASGSQISSITAGKTVYLHARVYNFSFKDINTTNGIIVRFYGQVINSDKSVSGEPFYIDEATFDSLPGLNSDNDNNWNIVTVSFPNTADYSDEELVFFVVTYAIDSDQNLISELPYYGLTEIPTQALNSISDVPIDTAGTLYNIDSNYDNISFSNNVGYYHSLFYITPETDSTQSSLNNTEGKVSIINKKFDFKKTPETGDKVTLKLTLAADNNNARGIETTIWDGDPTDSNSKIIEWEYQPIVRGDETAEVHVPYTLENCGPNRIYAVVQNQDANDSVTESIDYYIDCRETDGGSTDKYLLYFFILVYLYRRLKYCKVNPL